MKNHPLCDYLQNQSPHKIKIHKCRHRVISTRAYYHQLTPPLPNTPWFLKLFYFFISHWVFQHLFKVKQIGYTEVYAFHLAQESIDDTSCIRVFFAAQLYTSLVLNLGFICMQYRNVSKVYALILRNLCFLMCFAVPSPPPKKYTF